MPLKQRVAKLIQEYIAKHKGVSPTKVKLTPADEIELRMGGAAEVGDESASRLYNGADVREEFKKFMLLEIIWDADDTDVE